MNKCPVCEARKIDYLHKMELRILLNGLIGGCINSKENKEEYFEQKRYLQGLKKDGYIYLIQMIRKIIDNDDLYFKLIKMLGKKRRPKKKITCQPFSDTPFITKQRS